MNRSAVPIPEKLFFKIGEVCDLTGVQAHVLRYWESEFSMLAPQKNRAGQRTYRKRDVEMVLRIKDLLYEDQYTIAGAKKKLSSELRGASKLKVVTPEMAASIQAPAIEPVITSTTAAAPATAPQVAREPFAGKESGAASFEVHSGSTDVESSGIGKADEIDKRDALRHLAAELRGLLKLIDENQHESDHAERK